MRTLYYIFLAAAVLLAGCHKEMEENAPTKMEGKTYLTVSTAQTAIDPESKTHMGDNGTSTHPVYWSNGDRIAVNGMASDELSGLDEETQSVTFAFTDKILTPPYNILYPVSCLSLGR